MNVRSTRAEMSIKFVFTGGRGGGRPITGRQVIEVVLNN
jgi:hypothetical protein